jgi:hypothetical protein
MGYAVDSQVRDGSGMPGSQEGGLEEGGQEHGMEEYGEEEGWVEHLDGPAQEEQEPDIFSKNVSENEITDRFIHSTLLEMINEARKNKGFQLYWEDLNLIKPAQEYAQYLVEDDSEEVNANPGYLEGRVLSTGFQNQ